MLMDHQIYGLGSWVFRFPCRYLPDKFGADESVAQIEGVLVHSSPWRLGSTATPIRLKRRVWIRLYNFPEHHYVFEKASVFVPSISTLIDVDVGKARTNLSSFDVVVQMEESLRVPRGQSYVYDNSFSREVQMEVLDDVDIDWYMSLGIGCMNLSYGEIELYYYVMMLICMGVVKHTLCSIGRAVDVVEDLSRTVGRGMQ